MYWWRRFDRTETASDFARLREAGFDCVRVFLLWEDFQPEPDVVSQQALRRLVDVAHLAAAGDLSLVVTLFTGHMSGVNWLPQWALESQEESNRFRIVSGGRVLRLKPKNWYTDNGVLQAQALLAREVARTLAGHSAVWAYDLGNENSNCVIPPTREAAIEWLETISRAIRVVDSSHPITIGLHMEDLEEDRRLGPAEAARVCDFLCMHGYPIYARWARSETDELVLPFLGLVTRWLGGKEVLFEEFGAPTAPQAQSTRTLSSSGGIPLITDDAAALYTDRSLSVLRRAGMTGAMLWCFGDYDEDLWGEPPLDEALHERFFGLWRTDHSAKPAAEVIREFTGETAAKCNDDLAWIDVPAEDFYLNPRETLGHLYQRFLSSGRY